MSHPFSLTGKTILIVGTHTPTGEGVAAACAQMGATIIAQESFLPVDTPLDGLLYCTASAHSPLPFAQMTQNSIEQTITHRLTAPTLAIHAAWQGDMLRDGAAIVIEKTSLAHAKSNDGGSFLSVENGLDSMVASLALNCALRRIRVNSITTKAFPDTAHVDDFAHAAVYLLSPASRWVTGSNLVITGHATL